MAENKGRRKAVAKKLTKRARALSGAALFSLLILPLAPQAGHTQESAGIAVTPVFQEITLGEKSEEVFEIAVSNHGAVLVSNNLSVVDFGSLDESGGVAFLGGSTELEKKYSLASWMRPGTDTLDVSPGETRKVAIRVENRESLSPGGHYGAVVFRIGEKNESTPHGQIAINQIFSVLVFVKKIGGEKYGLALEGVEPERARFRLPETVRLRFQNRGNVHVVPRGLVTITDPFGRVVEKGVINEESSRILPETFRVYPVALQKMTPFLLPGRYTLSVAYRYDGREEFTQETSSLDFFFTPAMVVGLLILAMFWWYGAQYWKKRRKTSSLPKDE